MSNFNNESTEAIHLHVPSQSQSVRGGFVESKLTWRNRFLLVTQPKQDTLAARGLEEPFFQLCCCVSFWFWQEIGFGFIYYVLMYLEYNTVVVLC